MRKQNKLRVATWDPGLMTCQQKSPNPWSQLGNAGQIEISTRVQNGCTCQKWMRFDRLRIPPSIGAFTLRVAFTVLFSCLAMC